MSGWQFLPIGYLISIAIETPVLLIGLSRRHSIARRLFAGVWLTACSYPVVVLVLPTLIPDRTPYLWVAETLAPASEIALFLWLFADGRSTRDRSIWRDALAILAANLASFLAGELLF